jgi:hypothetical protein
MFGTKIKGVVTYPDLNQLVPLRFDVFSDRFALVFQTGCAILGALLRVGVVYRCSRLLQLSLPFKQVSRKTQASLGKDAPLRHRPVPVPFRPFSSQSHGQSPKPPFAISAYINTNHSKMSQQERTYRLFALHVRPSHLMLQISNTFVLLLRSLGFTVFGLSLSKLALEVRNDGLFAVGVDLVMVKS